MINIEEIKFRGMDLVKNWVYGQLISVSRIETTMFNIVDIDPSTAGQYSGRNDKNGKEIFEGDVICVFGVRNEVVEYRGCFVVGLQYSFRLNEFESEQIEVVGNLYENPELLIPSPPERSDEG